MSDDLIPVRVLIDVGIEDCPAIDNSYVTRACAAWAKRAEADLREHLRRGHIEAKVRSQAADYER